MTESEQRAAVVAEALTWVGTRYHHEGGVKHAGVDCGMLLVRVYTDAGIVDVPDPRPYQRDHMMRSDNELYAGIVQSCGAVEFAGPPGPGDIALWKFGRAYSHGAIVLDWPRVIHAHAKMRGVVVENAEQLASMSARPVRLFTCWPVSE
jgi:cell wall-associated NlpC family hydrolase